MANHGRIACCGAVSVYDGAAPSHGPRGVPGLIVTRRLVVSGFIVMDYEAQYDKALADLRGWVENGQLKVYEDVIEGFENLPAALVGLLAGENVGKRMVKVN
jgi:NADPH-dependent curcumin reductase CurA